MYDNLPKSFYPGMFDADKIVAQAKAAGMKYGIYYSQRDWHHPDYGPLPTGEIDTREADHNKNRSVQSITISSLPGRQSPLPCRVCRPLTRCMHGPRVRHVTNRKIPRITLALSGPAGHGIPPFSPYPAKPAAPVSPITPKSPQEANNRHAVVKFGYFITNRDLLVCGTSSNESKP